MTRTIYTSCGRSLSALNDVTKLKNVAFYKWNDQKKMIPSFSSCFPLYSFFLSFLFSPAFSFLTSSSSSYSFFSLRLGFTWSWLTSNLLCSQGWSWTSFSPASVSQHLLWSLLLINIGDESREVKRNFILLFLHPLPESRRLRQEDLCDLEASLVCIESSQ